MAKSERGVRAAMPEKYRALYKETFSRDLPNALGAVAFVPLTALLGKDRARKLANTLAGEQFAFADDRLIVQLDRIGTYGFILLPGGCAWALEVHGGCTFCPFQEAVDGYVGNLPISVSGFLNIFGMAFPSMENVNMLNVFTGGSFLNDQEVPRAAQIGIAQQVARSGVNILRVESRLRYITPESVATLVTALGGKTLDVAVGFETADDVLRNRLLVKGMTRQGLRTANRIIHENGGLASTYLMLKPHPVMTEGWAIEEAKASIRFAFLAGADEVLLQATYITGMPGDRNKFRVWHEELGFQPPSLWSIVEVLKETADWGPVMLGSWEAEVPPAICAPDDRNCAVCKTEIMEAIVAWRRTLDPVVFTGLDHIRCDCRSAWEAATADRSRPAQEAFDPYLPKKQPVPVNDGAPDVSVQAATAMIDAAE